VQSDFLIIKTVKTMKSYKEPKLVELKVKTEAGFATSYGAGTPGGDISYGDYGEEL
jgi:hypothetical protein